jgi:hypothetical protein
MRQVRGWLRGELIVFVGLAGAVSGCGSTKPLAPGVGGMGGRGVAGAMAVGGASGAAGTGDPGGAGAGGQDAGTTETTCPAMVPVAGESCNPKISLCAYGGKDNHACVTHSSCVTMDGGTTFQWEVWAPSVTCGTHPAPCPDTFEALAEGSACPQGAPTTCDYDLGRCGCEACTKGGVPGTAWACRAWASAEPGCPAMVPLVGEACVMAPSIYCNYGSGCGGISVGDAFYCGEAGWQIARVAYDCGVLTCPSGR